MSNTTTDKPKNLDCVMPAAGLSSRMGSWKMMLPYRHHTILDASIENALGFCSRVILVVGHNGEELYQRYKNRPEICVVHNPDYQQGMFRSIKAGVGLVRSEHFFICHGDMPCISPDIYRLLWLSRGEYTLFPGDKKRSGHPVLLHRKIKPVILKAAVRSKMKPLLLAGEVRYMGLDSPDIHFDVDTREVYQELCATT